MHSERTGPQGHRDRIQSHLPLRRIGDVYRSGHILVQWDGGEFTLPKMFFIY